MTSEQVMLALAVVLSLFNGCTSGRRADEQPVPRLVAPYRDRQVWAVAPLRNESGSLQVDGLLMADHLARQLEKADGLDVLPVNRVIAAMEALKMPAIRSPQDVTNLRKILGADALVVGTISAYDPYDPPKLGLAVELYADPARKTGQRIDVRKLSSAATGDSTDLAEVKPAGAPATSISGFFDAADPAVRERLQRYAVERGPEPDEDHPTDWRLFRMSMDLYTEFVSYTVSSRLLDAEGRRRREESPGGPLS
jgi:hypothetical protein